MAGITQAQLDALLAEFGGESIGPGQGRHQVAGPNVPGFWDPEQTLPVQGGVPGPPRHVIETPRGNVTVEVNADGTYTLVSAPNRPTAGAVAPHPATVGGGPAGTMYYDPDKKTWVPIEGTQPREPREPISASGGLFWRYNEQTGQMELVGADPFALGERQEAAEARRTAAARQAEADRLAAVNAQMNGIKLAMDAGEIDAKRANELRDYVWKTSVEFPQKLMEREETLQQGAIARGQQAGAAAVSDITAGLPYRYSPGFEARQQAVQAEALRGNYQPGIQQSIARSYRGPDLAGARGQAERQYENQYLQRFGFDPMEAAGQVGYRPAPAGAPPVQPLMDDEEELKELARQLATSR